MLEIESVGVGMTRALLRDVIQRVDRSYPETHTNLHEAFEFRILLHLVLHALLGDREVSYIDRVREAELSRSLEEDVPDSLDDRRLLALSHEDHFQKAAIAFAQVQHVAKDLVDELVNLTVTYDRWVGVAERTNEERLDGVQVTKILLLLVDELVDDAGRTGQPSARQGNLRSRTSGG